MSLSISRDLSNLTPEQPTVDENIAKANQMLQEYKDSLDREEVPMWLTNIIIRIFQEGSNDFMNETILAFLKTVMDNTQIDEQVYKLAGDQMKKTIPGKDYEPVIGEIMEGIGKELQKPE